MQTKVLQRGILERQFSQILGPVSRERGISGSTKKAGSWLVLGPRSMESSLKEDLRAFKNS